MNSLILGADFGQGLLNGLRTGFAANVLQPGMMFEVGELGAGRIDPSITFEDGSLVRALLHAGTGALGGLIMGDLRGALGGALGAGLSELVVPVVATSFDLNNASDATTLRGLSQILGGLGSLVVGDASMAGATSALNGFEFNRLLHSYPRASEMRSEQNGLRERLAQCGNCSERATLEAQLNQQIRTQIADAAIDQIGQGDWRNYEENDNFGNPSNKCNLFVADIIRLMGVNLPMPNGTRTYFGLPGTSPPSASQWANPDYSIAGWSVLPPGEPPQPGDVVAQRINYSDASGHVMIVGRDGNFVGTSGDGTIVSRTYTTFDTRNVGSGPMVYRRFTGR